VKEEAMEVISDYVGRTDAYGVHIAKPFLTKMAHQIDPKLEVDVVQMGDDVSLEIGNGRRSTRLLVTMAELVNCNSARFSKVRESQEELAARIEAAIAQL
jgi:hypothetical protein